MTLPSFLGIGAQKRGTSWLAHALSGHPDNYLPEVARERRNFDTNYERGSAWCVAFFARAPAGARITLPDCCLIAILSDPVDRVQSQYRMAYARGRFSGSLDAFLASNATALPRGFYGEQLVRYPEHYPRERMLVLIFEEVFTAPAAIVAAPTQIADFLAIDLVPFADHDVAQINANSGVPRFRGAYDMALKAGQIMRDWDMDWALELARAVGLKRGLFGATSTPPSLGGPTWPPPTPMTGLDWKPIWAGKSRIG